MVLTQDRTHLRVVPPDEGNIDLEGFYCIKTNEYNCRCNKTPWVYFHHNAKIIVWPNKDDEGLLAVASQLKIINMNPHIIEYKTAMGPAREWNDIPPHTVIE